MPSLGADMEAGTLVEWKVKPGDRVERGQVVALVETQKGAIDVEIWESGVVDRLVVEPGTKLPVGVTLAVLRAEGEAAAPAEAPKPPLAGQAAAKTAEVPPATRPRVSPAARRRAEELGVRIETLQPSQPGAAISLDDVERAAVKAAAQRAPAAERPADWRDAMRQAIAAAMSKSKREIPHYYLATDIDCTRMLAWLGGENAKRAVAQRILPAAALAKAVALALRESPALNGTWENGAFRRARGVHLGFAIAMRGGGLVAPAIRDADSKNMDELMAMIRDLIERVRGGRLRSSELTDGTATLTNLGEMGVERVYGVIYPPQVALIGLGRVSSRPWVADGTLTARQVVTATLAADHRASDGRSGAQFLSLLERLLQDPQRLESGA